MKTDSIPFARLRRLRRSPALRDMLAEVDLRPSQLILPLFVRQGRKLRREVGSMPGVFQLSPDEALVELRAAHALGVGGFILFGVIEDAAKDERGSAALDPDNIVCETLRLVKGAGLSMVAFTDLCFCEYTSHGHCGVLAPDGPGSKERTVDNDATLALLGKQAICHAQAGADVVAPSGMMDGMVAAIRGALDGAGFAHLPIMSYAVKYASAFYGPFRDAAGSAPSFGDRRAYQLDGRRRREARLEAMSDAVQGADLLMVKPGMPYLDVLRDLRESVDLPLAAYQVSGEYAMIQAAARNGWLDGRAAMMESLFALRRAGADLILTYFAVEAARALRS